MNSLNHKCYAFFLLNYIGFFKSPIFYPRPLCWPECRTPGGLMPKRWAREPCNKPGKKFRIRWRNLRWARKHTRLENDQAGIFLTKLACLCSRPGPLVRTIFKRISKDNSSGEQLLGDSCHEKSLDQPLTDKHNCSLQPWPISFTCVLKHHIPSPGN